jgi:hypothetical protein
MALAEKGTREHECRIRDFYAKHLHIERPDELVIATEHAYSGGCARADMITVDHKNLLRVWEFKIKADYEALGQILTYVALAKLKADFQRPIRGVIAAFEFRREIQLAIEMLNLNIEQAIIPAWMAQAGRVPELLGQPMPTVEIPFTKLS